MTIAAEKPQIGKGCHLMLNYRYAPAECPFENACTYNQTICFTFLAFSWLLSWSLWFVCMFLICNELGMQLLSEIFLTLNFSIHLLQLVIPTATPDWCFLSISAQFIWAYLYTAQIECMPTGIHQFRWYKLPDVPMQLKSRNFFEINCD